MVVETRVVLSDKEIRDLVLVAARKANAGEPGSATVKFICQPNPDDTVCSVTAEVVFHQNGKAVA